MSCIFGPVPSRRLGFSLGVDLVPFKVCSLDCIYCQIGKTTCKTVERKEYVSCEKILAELEKVLKSSKNIDYITLSGSGEPTLNSKTGEIIRRIKEITSIPVAVITNATLLSDDMLKKDLLPADLVMPSLDGVTQAVFEKANRPCASLKAEETIKGLIDFSKVYKGKIWLEIMLVKGINDTEAELNALKSVVKQIKPDKIQLNTPVRPPSEEWAKTLSASKLAKIKDFFGDKCEIIATFNKKGHKAYLKNVEDEILTLISRRPVTSDDISSSLGLHINEVIKYVGELERQKKISLKIYQGKRYFQR
ncbi:radical SAM protein [bacterium]|nr:radical SAM protein [bacterium]